MDERERARQVGERISHAMRDAGLNAAGLAARIGRHETQVGRYLSGATVPDWQMARAIAAALGVPAQYLLAPLFDDGEENRDTVLLEAEQLLRALRRGDDEPQKP